MKTKAKISNKKPNPETDLQAFFRAILPQTEIICGLLKPGSTGELKNGKSSAATWRKANKALEKILIARASFGPRSR